jgi:hypothetical protein
VASVDEDDGAAAVARGGHDGQLREPGVDVRAQLVPVAYA